MSPRVCPIPAPRSARRRGLSLPEVLIAIAIAASMMTAVAGAFIASTSAVESNDRFIRTAQGARVALGVLIRDIRQADACQVGASAQQDQSTITADTLDVLDVDGRVIRYHYNALERLLTMQIDSGVAHVLARNVESAAFVGEVETVPGTEERRTVRVTVRLVLQTENHPLRLDASATPRRAMSL